jgi:hypothetical protein
MEIADPQESVGMWRLAMLVLLSGIALPAFPADGSIPRKVTVEQLEQRLSVAHRQRDVQAANQIYELELTERMSTARLARAEGNLPGPVSQKALLAIFDEAVFLDLPAADLLHDPAPDHSSQTAMLARTIEYANKTIAKLPNLFATKDTTHFEGTQMATLPTGMSPIGYETLHEMGISRSGVLYRNGRESVNAEASRREGLPPLPPELSTNGEFGPILVVTLGDAAKGKIVWSHWEQSAAGPEAVFHYDVPEAASRYAVAFPGIFPVLGETVRHPAYHGEIGVNPADGSILRLTMVAELKPDDPVTEADILVEYGPVEIGGKTYICPLKSVDLVRFAVVGTVRSDTTTLYFPGFLKTQVNDNLYKQYHLFRAEIRILP